MTLYLKGQFRAQGQQQQRDGGGGGGGGGGNTVVRKNRLRLSGIPFEATQEEVVEALQGLDLPISNVFLPPFRANPVRNIGTSSSFLALFLPLPSSPTLSFTHRIQQ